MIFDLFSKRKKQRERHGQQDVYQYNNLPQSFRVQVIHIWRDALGSWCEPGPFTPPAYYFGNNWWRGIFRTMTREKATFRLGDAGENPFVQCQQFLLAAPTDDALDMIEVSFKCIDAVHLCHPGEAEHMGLMSRDDAVEELNGRFREHGIGYEYAGGEIVRVDSQYVHAEAVKPALQLLHDGGKLFAGPLEEFMAAHKHYRERNHKDAILNAGKAFESVLKAICTARRWTFDPHRATAKDLIEIVFSNGLVPSWLQGEFTSLRAVLESGVPTVRNKAAGHGQGATPTPVPDYLASYVLHLTASNIVFLVKAHKTQP